MIPAVNICRVKYGLLMVMNIVIASCDGTTNLAGTECGITSSKPDSAYSLSWDPVQDNDLSEYIVYYGTETPLTRENSLQHIATGKATNVTFSPQTDCRTIYVAITATGLTKDESYLSNQISIDLN